MGNVLLIDPARIHEITRGQVVLLLRFIPLLGQTLSETRPALSSSSAEERQRAAHRLKGACANLGALALYDLAVAIEQAADVPDAETLQRFDEVQQATFKEFERMSRSMDTPRN